MFLVHQGQNQPPLSYVFCFSTFDFRLLTLSIVELRAEELAVETCDIREAY